MRALAWSHCKPESARGNLYGLVFGGSPRFVSVLRRIACSVCDSSTENASAVELLFHCVSNLFMQISPSNMAAEYDPARIGSVGVAKINAWRDEPHMDPELHLVRW